MTLWDWYHIDEALCSYCGDRAVEAVPLPGRWMEVFLCDNPKCREEFEKERDEDPVEALMREDKEREVFRDQR